MASWRTEVNRLYLKQGQLNVEIMAAAAPGWTPARNDSLLEAGQFIATLEHRQGLKIARPEEIAWQWLIDAARLNRSQPSPLMLKNGYGQYLMRLIREKAF